MQKGCVFASEDKKPKSFLSFMWKRRRRNTDEVRAANADIQQQQKGPTHQSAAGIWPGWLFFAVAAADDINMPEIRPISRATN